MECGPAPVLLLVGRVMASLVAEDASGRGLVDAAVEGLGLRE